MSVIRATALPKIRDRMATLLTDPGSALNRGGVGGDVLGDAAGAIAGHLRVGELYWVSSDMAALATAAARELDTVRWTSADRPAPTGLIVMDGGIGWLPAHGTELPVDAISWGPHDGELLLFLWVARRRIEENLRRGGVRRLEPGQAPHLVPMAGYSMPVSADEQPVTDLEADVRTLATILAAAWHLMEQPTLAEQAQHPADRSVQRAYSRDDRPAPEVTVVDLRTLYRPTGPDHAPAEGRTYSHRWVVRGHWRDQAHGPGRALRKRIWVPDHLKGPDGAPLLAHERVNVWRR